MMARSVSSANPINRRQTATALPLLLELPTEFQRLDVQSAIDLADARRLQSLAHRFANRASRDRKRTGSNCGLQPDAISALDRFAKRIVDLLVGSITMLLLWPLMLVTAVAVKFESRGPVIYRSLRAGKRGAPFVCDKFRTMFPGANTLRKNSLDKLPQFWNVLKGDMSLVGPCPHPFEDAEQYGPRHGQRLGVKPGMTGLW